MSEQGQLYLVIGMQIAENVKTRREEMELTLFDLTADSEDGAILVLNTSHYTMERRDAQWHEVERAGKTIATNFPTFPPFENNS